MSIFKKIKLDLKLGLILGLIVTIIFLLRGCKEVIEVEVPVRIEVPVPVKEHTSDTIYLPSPIKENPVNRKLLEKYVKTKDSLEKLKLYKDAIVEREYNQKFEDTFQTVEVYTKTQGKLLEQSIKYETKPYTIPVDTTIKVKIPKKIEFYAGGSIGLPLRKDDYKPSIQGNLFIKNKKDNILNLSVNTNGYIYLGYNIKL